MGRRFNIFEVFSDFLIPRITYNDLLISEIQTDFLIRNIIFSDIRNINKMANKFNIFNEFPLTQN